MLTQIRLNNNIQDNFLLKPYRVHIVLFVIMIALGFMFDTPQAIFTGLWEIIISTDLLVTDYIAVGGIGAAFVNSALSGLLAISAMVFARLEPKGLAIAVLSFAIGMAFFGKNLVNMFPIIFGGWLYSKFMKISFKDCVLPSVMATCLAPVVTRFAFVCEIPTVVGIIIGVVLGIGIGFIITPFAFAVRKTHEGYNLYNVGFAAGVLAVGMFAVIRTLGINQYILDNWSSGHNFQLTALIIVISVYYIICGIFSRSKPLSLNELFRPDAEDYDHYNKYSGLIYVSMGIAGIICVFFMLAVRGEYNGVVIGAIISIIGFGAFGKPILSSVILICGAMLAAAASTFITGVPINDRSFLVAALFATCLAPIATRFGWKWGLAAGFLHLSLSIHVAIFQGGMNLYNNGFAGGVAAMILVPIIKFFAKAKTKRNPDKQI